MARGVLGRQGGCVVVGVLDGFFQTASPATPPAAQTAAPSVADAFLNFGHGPYSEASLLTVGTPTPWYDSPAVTHAYGYTPSASEQAAFTSEVLADVNTTFSLAGLHPVVRSTRPLRPTTR